jgi:hypothetical protein
MRRIGNAGFFDTVKRRLADVLDTLDRWSTDGTIDKASTALSGAFTTAADGVNVVLERLRNHIAWLNANWEKMEGPIKGAGAGFLLLILRLFPLTRLMLLLGLAVDSFLTWLQGGDSIIGRAIEKFKEFNEWVKELWKSFQEFMLGISKWSEDVHKAFHDFGRDMGQKILDGLKSVGQDIKQWFIDLIPDWAKSFFGISGNGFSTGGSFGGEGFKTGGYMGKQSPNGVRARAGRSSAGYQGRVPLNSAEAAELRDAINREAPRAGIPPEDLATVMSFETGGTYNKDKWGGAGGRHLGLIQMGPNERRQFGYREGMSASEAVKKSVDFLIARGFKPGMSFEQLYATINAGSPHKGHLSDARNGGTWGTAADKARHQMHGHRANAKKLMGGSAPIGSNAAPAGGPANNYLGWKQKQESEAQSYGPQSNNTSINAPISINVAKSTEAPAATARAVQTAVNRVRPARMQASPAA